MNLDAINWLAVVVCIVVSIISGSLWYNPKTFFPIWWKVVGAGREQPGMENMGMTWGLTVLSSFVQAVAMAIMVQCPGNYNRKRWCGDRLHALVWFHRPYISSQQTVCGSRLEDLGD